MEKRNGKKQTLKRMTALLTAVCLFAAMLFCDAVPAEAKVTDAYPGYTGNYAGLKWALKLGEGWQSSPTPPAVHGEYIYCAKSTQIVKIDKETGKIVKTADITKGQKFTIIPIKYIEADEDNELAEDIIAVPLYNGQVQIFTADDLVPQYTTVGSAEAQKMSGIQLTTNIAYDNGYIYFGTWYGEEYDGFFYCYRIGEQEPVWTVTKKGGFYLSDPYIGDDLIYFGSDNGLKSNDGGTSTLFACTKGGDYTDGDAVVYKEESIMKGNCRAAVVSDGSSIFTVTQAGKAYRFDLNSGGSFTKVCEADLGAASTGEATVYNGVIYYCLADSTVVSLKTENLSKISSISVPGYVQGGIALSTAKEDEEGSVYIYGSYNREPAGIFAVKASPAGEFESSIDLFTPPSSMTQYNMTPVTLEGDRIYYRNDSGNIMALEPGYTLWTQAGSGGSVAAGLSAEAGSTQTFAITPAAGYKCAAIIVDGTSAAGAASYTFENVQAPHELTAVFMQKAGPAITSVTQARYDRLTVSWKAAAGVTAYELYRAASANGTYAKIATLTARSYTDTRRITGTKYYYKVKGIYKSESVKAETAMSAAAGGKTALAKTTVKAKAKKGRKALIKWKKVAGATGYEVYRATKKNGKYKKVKTIKKGKTLKWTNKKLKKGRKYYYKVKAVRKANGKTVRSAFSNRSYCKAKK